jgi:hypothetical protein
LKLREASNEPITVYINSNGGELRCLRYILDLLKEPTPEGESPHLITVGIGNVGSAAAALLGLGDYSIAYPSAGIHFHGARLFDVAELTVEMASHLASQLEESNRVMASNLAKASCERLAFLYWTFNQESEDDGKTSQDRSVMSIEGFAGLLRRHLTVDGSKIVSRAMQRWKAIQEISNAVKTGMSEGLRGVDFEAEVLTRIVQFEVAKSKQDKPHEWSPSRVLREFMMLKEYDTGSHNQFFEKILHRFGDAFFTTAEAEQMRLFESQEDKQQEFFDSKAKKTLLPFCYFAASVCLTLHQLENPLTAHDAYWLGEVDEVYGSQMPCIRVVEESDEPEKEEF